MAYVSHDAERRGDPGADCRWREVRQSGSHKQFRHAERNGTVTVQHPKAELAIGTLKSIERQSGVRLR